MCKFKFGEVVYVAHPFGNKPSNRRKAAKIIKKLYEDCPGITFVSPLLAFNVPGLIVSYIDAMDRCLKLLSKCDSLLLSGNWKDSPGCTVEAAYAKRKHIKIQKLGDDFERT